MAIDPNIKRKADDIRNKTYGSEVRESLASGLEEMSTDVTETISRQMQLDSQFQTVVDGTTGKDVISAPEIIAARNGKPNLKARIDSLENETNAKLADLGSITAMEEILNSYQEDIDETLGQVVSDTQSATNSLLDSVRGIVVNIKDFGVVYDDPNFDNMPKIAEAQDYVVANGGGTIYFPDDGVLYVKPFLRMKSGVSFLGATSRPVIRVAPSVTNFYAVFLVEYVKHVSIRNLTIDSNRDNRSNFDISTNPQILITLSEAEYVDVEKNTLIGNGVWVFSVFTGGDVEHSRYIKLNHNHIIWEAGHSTDIIGESSQVDVDNTTVYWDAIDYEMIGNYIETKDGVKNMTCIEQHGANATLRDNYIDGFRTGLIVWSIVSNTPNVARIKDNNLDVINNTFVNVEAGITNGATSNSTYGDFDLTNVKINGNKILLDTDKFDRPAGRGIEIYLRTEGTTLEGRNIEIENNIIDSLPSSRSFADSSAAYNFTGITIGAGRLSGIKVKNNTIRNIHGVGLMIGGGFPEKLSLSDSVIEGNVFIDCGKGGNISFDGFQHRTAMTILRNQSSVLNRVHIGVNHIFDSKTDGGTYFTRPVNGLTSEDADQLVKSVDRENWSGKTREVVRMQIEGEGNDYINENRLRNLTIEKDSVKIVDSVWIDKTYNGFDVYLHLPIEADITADWLGGTWTHFKHATQETISGSFRILSNQKKVAWFRYPTLEGRQLAREDRIWFEIEYPVKTMDKYMR